MRPFILTTLLCCLLVPPVLAQDVTLTQEEVERIIKVLPNGEEVRQMVEDRVAAVKAQAADERAQAVRPAKAEQFLRISRDKRGRAMTLDTAIVRYVLSPEAQGTPAPDGTDQALPEPVYVDLIGAVHVGERFYYRQLNKQFKEYDVLLYELVAEKGTVPGKAKPAEGLGGVRSMQGMMTTILGLQHQMEGVDYTPDNFIHADMSPADLKQRMAQRGESPMVYFLETMANALREQQKPQKKVYKNPADTISDEELLLGLLQGFLLEKPSPVVKRYMASQFEDMDTQMKAFSGGMGRLIIDDRNKAAFKVLDEQLAKGEKGIAVFYGAAHLPDMEKRLLKRGFKKEGVVWVEAWLLR